MPDGSSRSSAKPQAALSFAGLLAAPKLSFVLAAAGASIVAAAAIFAAFFVISLRDSEVKSIRNRLEIPAQAVSQLARGIARAADVALRDIQTAAGAENGSVADLRQLLADRDRASRTINKIEIYNAAGRPIVSSAADPPSPVSVSDYGFFKRQMAASDNQMAASELIADPLDGRATIVASRPLFGPRGVARGVIAVYFDTERLQEILDSLPMPPGASVTLFNREGRQLVRNPAAQLGDRRFVTDYSQNARFPLFRDSGPDGVFGQFTTTSGTERFIAGIGDENAAFVVTAGWETASALAHWRSEAVIIALFTLATIAVVAGLFAHIVAGLRRNEALLTAVTRSEEQFRALMAALPDAVMIINRSLTIDFANRSAEGLYGYAPGEMHGLPLRNLMVPIARLQDEQSAHESFENPASSGIRAMERTAMRKDGSELPIEINARPYESPNGRMLVSVIRDVSKRQANDRALYRSRANLARAQRLAAVGSFDRDLVTGEVEWSDEFMRVWGIEHIPKNYSVEFLAGFVHGEDRQKFVESRDAVVRGRATTQPDFRIIRPDGAERILHTEYSLDVDEGGKIVRLFGTVQDITERKKIENELRRSRENLARAQRVASIGSFERNLITGEMEFSDEFYRIHGVVRGGPQATLEFLLGLVHPEDRGKVEQFRRAAQAVTTVPPINYRIIRPDGVERVLHRECDISFDEYGTPVCIFATMQDITERNAAEIELRRSRENLARAQRIAGIGSFEHDLITGKVEWSEELYRVYGRSAEEGDGNFDSVISLVHPEDREKFRAVRDQAIEGIRSTAIDFRIVRLDGEERILHRECDVTFDAAGKAVRIFGTIQDVTERKKIELELHHSREDLTRAQRIAGIGSFGRDLATGVIEWSDEFLRIWGIKAETTRVTADLLATLVHPDDRQRFLEGRDVAISNRVRMPLDFRITRPDGEERILHREYGVISDANGKPARLFGTVQDITERKKIELELLRSRENLARAQRMASMGSFERDVLADKAEWSEEMYRILGLDKADGVPASDLLKALIHPEDRARVWAYRSGEIAGQPVIPLEYRIIRPDGAERIVRRESDIVRDHDGRPIRVYGTLQDITEQRQAERRERELERQLLHSQKLEALGTLAGGIAHDLNNTLVPIMALSKLTARQFEAGGSVRTNLEIIYDASVRARDLVKRVVAFGRKDESEKRETNIADIVDEALKLLRATIPSSITLETRIGKVPSIPADASQIHQVVTNLVSNASQAIGNEIGTVTVTLSVVPVAKDRSEICLSVSDTGMGMDKATQQRIFEPFFTTKPVGQGTGLGLSIVHGIVSGHHGRIEVESAPGRGTRFDLYFPVPPAAAELMSSRPAA